jgi:hypothetical protein
MSFADRLRRALAGLTGDKSGPASKREGRQPEGGRGGGGGHARSTQEAASAPNPSVAAEEVD